MCISDKEMSKLEYLNISEDLFEKYNVSCPRYTSYPSIPYWSGIDESQWNKALLDDLRTHPKNISLYIHVPFCKSPCAFCGCTKIITNDRKWAKLYIESLIKEARIKREILPAGVKVHELHVGGGTPTWLEASEMEALFSPILSEYEIDKNEFSFSIEVDPRTLKKEHVLKFKDLGVTRVSLGVQDFHGPTMKAIARKQDYNLVAQCVDLLREHSIEEINFDLVYGLPLQSPESLRETFEKVSILNPKRIAFYAYAHVPSLKPAQKFLEKSHIPVGREKHDLFELGQKLLIQAGYHQVGMDHFAKMDDELFQIQKAGKLNRNFMGYTITNTTALLGLGPSSVSSTVSAFAQNEKDPSQWIERLEKNEPIIVNGHLLTKEDVDNQNLIKSIMCSDFVRLPKNVWTKDSIKIKIDELSKDGLLELRDNQDCIKLTELGKNFRRNIASIFDPYFSRSQKVIHSRA